ATRARLDPTPAAPIEVPLMAVKRPKAPTVPSLKIPPDATALEVRLGAQSVQLTNLKKPFWPELGITKGDLIQYYADVAHALLPHLKDRAMVMRRYPNGAAGKSFFMK